MKLTPISIEIAVAVIAFTGGIFATWAMAPEPVSDLREQLRAHGFKLNAPVHFTDPGVYDLLYIRMLARNEGQQEPAFALARIEAVVEKALKAH